MKSLLSLVMFFSVIGFSKVELSNGVTLSNLPTVHKSGVVYCQGVSNEKCLKLVKAKCVELEKSVDEVVEAQNCFINKNLVNESCTDETISGRHSFWTTTVSKSIRVKFSKEFL